MFGLAAVRVLAMLQRWWLTHGVECVTAKLMVWTMSPESLGRWRKCQRRRSRSDEGKLRLRRGRRERGAEIWGERMSEMKGSWCSLYYGEGGARRRGNDDEGVTVVDASAAQMRINLRANGRNECGGVIGLQCS